MPTTRKRRQQLRDQDDEPPYGSPEDRVSKSVTLYPVFCTVNIPSAMLDDFIDQAYEGWFDLVRDPTSSGPSPCILQTTDLDSIAHGSRKPMPDFESPFLGMTDDEVREWMMKHSHPNFAESTFTILDQTTVECRISRIGYVSPIRKYHDDRMLWADFYADLYTRLPITMCTISWEEIDEVGTGKVYTREAVAEEIAET